MATNAIKIQDHVLLSRAIHKKDRKALGLLHSIYYPRIKHYIALRINSVTEAQDLAQNVFLELCKSNGTYKGPKNAEAYLFVIAKNLIALHYRNQSRQVRTISMESVGEISADIQPAEQVSQQELRDLIALLPPKAQEAIRLRFIEGFSLKDAAKRTGCSIHVFCQRIYEAKKIIETIKPGLDNNL